jgi:F0F1-type ATP synthase assembly protein I
MANCTTPTVTTFQALAVASQFGITLAISVVLGYLAGHWLDDRLNTGIIFSLIGVLLGLVAAVLNTVRLYNALMRKQSAQTMESVRSADEGDPKDHQ